MVESSFSSPFIKSTEAPVNMSGYDPEFTGMTIPLPTFVDSQTESKILKKPDSEFFDSSGFWRNYIHYSVAMNKERRSPICVALNIDQSLIKTVDDKGFKIDSEIGKEYQLNNDYYRENDWDRGHMAKRESAAWGKTSEDAKNASDATFYYSNCCLQHENLNRDEWKDLEDWVLKLNEDSNDKVVSFTGPIYDESVPVKYVTPPGRSRAEVPSSFFKIAAFVGKESNKLETRAFIIRQNETIIADKDFDSKMEKPFTPFQVTTALIEEKTGLVFHDSLKTSNPMKSEEPPTEISGPDDIVNGEMSPSKDNSLQVFIAAALIDPAGKDINNEWIEIVNKSPLEVNLDGWTLSNPKKSTKPFALSGKLASGETRRIDPRSKKDKDSGILYLTNAGATVSLKSPDDKVIDEVSWEKSVEGEVSIFHPF